MCMILFHINKSNDKDVFVLIVYDNSSPLLACIFVMELLSLNSYCSAVLCIRYTEHRLTNQSSQQMCFFHLSIILVGENQGFRETSFRN